MRFRILALIAVLAFVWALPIDAQAQPSPRPQGPGPGQRQGGGQQQSGDVLQKITPEAMAQLLNQAGYASRVQVANNQKYVIAQFWPQLAAQVAFAGCDQGGCSMVVMLVNLGKDSGVGADWVNAWNQNKPFVSAVLDADGSLGMVMWTHLFGGATPEHLSFSAQVFVQVVNTASDFQPK